MQPILWPIQIHGIVLEVSEDKSEVTICDFGITSVKDEEKKIKECQGEQPEKIVEEENAIFTEAIKDERMDTTATKNDINNGNDESESPAAESGTKKNWWNIKKKENQRLNVIKLTKWSDLRKWSKVNYERGLFDVGKSGGMGKGLKNLGKKTEQLWSSVASSVTKSIFVNVDDNDNVPKEKKVPSVRYDVDEKTGYCVHHPTIQLKKWNQEDEEWVIVRKKCPMCIQEDCPAMMGDEISLGPSFLSTEDEHSVSQSSTAVATSFASTTEASSAAEESTLEEQTHTSDTGETSSETKIKEQDEEVSNHNGDTVPSKESGEESKTMEQMLAEANAVEARTRVAKSPEKKKAMSEKKKSWHGSFMKSVSNLFPQKNGDTQLDENDTKGSVEDREVDTAESENKPKTWKDLPRSDPAILVLARTRFILEHGENVLPPYHIINSNSECIAVWCKTGRWSTLQASVFLHSTAIGHAKSATALTLGVAATNPWLIPAFATVGIAAVGTPWLFLKVANDKWQEATKDLTEKFWSQADNEVYVECIEKWSNLEGTAETSVESKS